MSRKIVMRGSSVQYKEMRAQATPDDGREILMEGDSVCYNEMDGVSAVEENTLVAAVKEYTVLPETTATARQTTPLPECLATAAAKVYWQRLKDAGFVDENCMLLSTTSRQQAWVIAEMFAERVKKDNMKWKLFQDFWNIRNLAQERNYSKASGLLPPRYNEIVMIFDKRKI